MRAFDDFILGADERCKVSTDPQVTQLNNNILVVGGSGSGKTTSVMQPILLHMQHSNAIGVFTKSMLLEESAAVLRRRGYKVHILRFDEPSKSDFGYDPLLSCETESDVQALAHFIVYAGMKEDRNDPYWDTSAEGLLLTILRYVHDGHYAKGRTMLHALELLDHLQWTDDWEIDDYDDEEEVKEKQKLYPLHQEFIKLKEVDPVGDVTWKTFLKLPFTTGGCVAGSTQTPLQKMFPSEIRALLSAENNFAFKELLKPKTCLFVCVSPASTVHHRFVNLFYHQIFNKLFSLAEKRQDKRLPHPIHILCDDFATGCAIPGFPELISVIREKDMAVTMLIQSESQLASIYGANSATTIINNCDTYIYLGGMDIKTCDSVAKRLNRPSYEVQCMPLGQEYYFRRGQKPIVTRRYDTFADPVYLREVADANVLRQGA